MDRRREPRIESYQTVKLTMLGEAGFSCRAHAIQLSAGGMRLVLDEPVPVSAAVKVEADDWLALGEVCYCRHERAYYSVGLRLDQALVGLRALDETTRQFRDEVDEVNVEVFRGA